MSGEFWNQEVEATGPLSAEDLVRAAEAIRNQKPHPCRTGQHLVHARALYKPGVYPCGDCGAPVTIPYPLSESVHPNPPEGERK